MPSDASARSGRKWNLREEMRPGPWLKWVQWHPWRPVWPCPRPCLCPLHGKMPWGDDFYVSEATKRGHSERGVGIKYEYQLLFSGMLVGGLGLNFWASGVTLDQLFKSTQVCFLQVLLLFFHSRPPLLRLSWLLNARNCKVIAPRAHESFSGTAPCIVHSAFSVKGQKMRGDRLAHIGLRAHWLHRLERLRTVPRQTFRRQFLDSISAAIHRFAQDVPQIGSTHPWTGQPMWISKRNYSRVPRYLSDSKPSFRKVFPFLPQDAK